jgi:dTDP-4-dehydrorhamnose reductase
MTPGRPRLLIIGARGFLGSYVAALGSGRFECLPAGRNNSLVRLDIIDAGEARRVLERTRPSVVVLTAALSDIDDCERRPVMARLTNVAGAGNIARECARVGARILFTSSAAVFDGEALEYTEESSPNPLSVYGKSKVEAECMVAAECPGAVVVRLSLVLGAGLFPGTNSWLDKLRAQLAAAQPVAAPPDEYRNAIDVETAAQWILDLAAAPAARGIFHLGSADALSRFEIARHLARAWGYPERLVTAANGEIPNRAPRGRRHMLRTARIAEFSSVPVPTCLQSLERCVHAVA